MRLIHAVRELNEERAEPIRLIALCTEAERNAMFVRHADEAFDLGAATFVDPADGGHKNRYLDYTALEHALVATAADAAWVGWGFVAERPRFAELCDQLGIVFVGPDAAVMRLLGDKINAKRLAEEADVPVAAWGGGRRRARHPTRGESGRAERRVRSRPRGGPIRVRGRHRAAGEADHAGSSRRGAGDRRRP